MKPSAIRRKWEGDRERRVRQASRKVMDALEALPEDGARRVMRVIVACHEAGCLDDLGAILRPARPTGGEA